MDEMIAISLKHMKEMFAGDLSYDETAALQQMRSFFPLLARWKT